MTNESRKIFILFLTVFIIISAFVPSLNPLPSVNNSTSETPLIKLYTDSLNSSRSSDAESWLRDAIGTSGYGDEYMLALDNLIFMLIGVLLVMFIFSVIILIVSQKSGIVVFIRIIAILNTLTYAALIGLTIYQNNKLSDDTWGISDRFITISPSTGAYVGVIASFVLIFIAKRERLQVATRHNYNTKYRQNPPTINEHIQAQNSVNISEKDFKGLELDDIISASREFCYRNRILKKIMPFTGIILIIQTVIVGKTILFVHSYSRFSAVSYIINSNLLFVIIVALCLINKNYLVVAIYETLLILLNLFGGFNGTFAWINILVMIVIDVYAIKMFLKNRELSKDASMNIQMANNIQEQIFCQSCGKSCNKGTKFCNTCGNKLS